MRRRRLRRLRTVVGVSAGSLSIPMLAIACTKSAQDAVATFRYLSRVIDTRHTMFASGWPDPVEQVVEFARAPPAVHYCNFVRTELSEIIGNPDATLSEVDRFCGLRYRVLVYETDSHTLAGARPLVLGRGEPPRPAGLGGHQGLELRFPVISPVRVRAGAPSGGWTPRSSQVTSSGRAGWSRTPGQHLVVHANGLRTMSLWQLSKGIWGFSELEVLLLWAIATWRGIEPDATRPCAGPPRAAGSTAVLRAESGDEPRQQHGAAPGGKEGVPPVPAKAGADGTPEGSGRWLFFNE